MVLKNSFRLLAYLVVFLSSIPPILAADVLTLQAVFNAVETRHPYVAIRNLEVEQGRNLLLSSQGAFDPVLNSKLENTNTYYDTLYSDTWLEQPTVFGGATLIAGYRNGRGDFPTYDGAYKTNSDGEFRGGVKLPLLKNFGTDARRTDLRQNELSLQAAERQYSFELQTQKKEASKVYWEWVAEGLELKVVEEVLKLAENRNEALIIRVKHGDLPEFEQQDNLRSILQRKGSLANALKNYQTAAYKLSLYLRDEKGEPIVPSLSQLPKSIETLSPLSDKTIQNEILAALNIRNDLAQLRLTREQYELDYYFASNQILPKLDLSFFWSQDRGEGTAKLNEDQYKTGLYFEFPVLMRKEQGKILYYKNMMEKISLQQRYLSDRIGVDLKTLHYAFGITLDRIQLASQETILAKKLEESEYVRFSNGDSSILILNLREQAYADARVREIESKADAQKVFYELKFVKGEI